MSVLGWLADAVWVLVVELLHGAVDLVMRRPAQLSAEAIYDVLLDVDPLVLTSCEEMEDTYRALAAELFEIAASTTSRRELRDRVVQALQAAAGDGRARSTRAVASRIARMRQPSRVRTLARCGRL